MEDLFNEIEAYLKNPTDDNNEKLLTAAEVERLILSLAEARGEEGFDEAEAMEVVRWAEGVRVGEGLLGLVLKGLCDVNWIDGEIAVRATELGKKVVNGEDS